ncbi:Bug family tripartite tricarboxylate transporter substrate binding protein [Ramlibacter sp.]|uniref:Bug family tripartite tricarboxylate transporter substrate binding protein n=1 Tax=Ramlibacter sp. TaxID=1917967 RepID=UPI003D0CE9C2
MKSLFLRPIAAVLACASVWPAASIASDSFPQKPVTVLIPAGPGGSVDRLARIIHPKLSESLGQPVVIDYKPGASGVIAEELLVKSMPDGHTILLDASTVTMNAVLLAPKLRFDIQKDMLPVTCMVRYQHMLVVHPSVPARTVPEFVEYIRANPGKVNYASAGTGSAQHVVAEIFLRANGLKATNVNYKGGGQMLLAVASGDVHFSMFGVNTGAEFVKAGKLRALAVLDEARAKTMSGTPTFTELGYKNMTSPWAGVFVPRATPATVVQRIHLEMTKALRDPGVQQQLAAADFPVCSNTPAEFARMIADEIALNATLVRDLQLKAE